MSHYLQQEMKLTLIRRMKMLCMNVYDVDSVLFNVYGKKRNVESLVNLLYQIFYKGMGSNI